MKKFKRALALSLTAAMGLSLVACGNGGDATTTAAPETEAATEAAATGDDASASTATEASEIDYSNDGTVLNIQVWNAEFSERLRDYLPNYKANDPEDGLAGGVLTTPNGDITVKFTQTPSDDNAYQNNLDTVLPGNADAAADDKVDIFLVEADYALKYVNADTEVAEPIADLGITDDEIADQYQYTKDIVTDGDGVLRGLSWQACSAGLIYNREIAKEVIGSDDPADVQEAVKDWAAYEETAAKMADAGYLMTSSTNDTYRVYSNNVTKKWVSDDGVIQLDDNIKAWIDNSKAEVEANETTTNDLWGDDWSKGFYPDGKVFAYFGPAWFFNFSMAYDPTDDNESVADNGGWGFVVGPQSFYWGGTWICAATGNDNPGAIRYIMEQMTTNPEVMKAIATGSQDCVNSKTVLADLASSDDGNIDLLGGQNPYKELAAGAEKIDMSNISNYDQGCNESIQAKFKDYFDGKTDYDSAYDAFVKDVQTKYPSLKAE